MILTCPECASRYFVDDAKVGATGRVVRCANCGARWNAKPDAVGEGGDGAATSASAAAATVDPATTAAAAEAANTPTGAPAPASAADGEPEPEPPISALPGEELPKVFRARADADRRLREATATGVVWAVAAAAIIVLCVAAVVFRIEVVRMWPRTAGAYATLGLPVNKIGLVVDKDSLKAEPSLEDGHAAVTITGVIRNITDRPVIAPPLRVSLLNAQGKRVAGKIAAAADPRIPSGQTRHFAITIIDPPLTAKDLEIGFALEPGAAKAVKTALKRPGEAATAGDPALRGAQSEPAQGTGQDAAGHATAAPSADSHGSPPRHD
ncbi:MAG: hypothetical protein JWP92_871 [Caulobacter sp.]|nr:hypothetical protein [Caulobacter sp.]